METKVTMPLDEGYTATGRPLDSKMRDFFFNTPVEVTIQAGRRQKKELVRLGVGGNG